MMGWKHTATAMLMGAIASNVAIVQVVDAKSLTSKEVYDSANQFVVKIDGDDGGSGFIVRKSGNRYTVLTNDHVTKTSDQHNITTHDGKTYTSEGVRSFKSANGLDLAEIEFESDERYQVAQLASRPNYSVGTKVYTVGWNATNPTNPNNFIPRRRNLLEGTISGSQPQNASGYTLTMNLIAVPGMSGSPLLDDNGNVIGIYGQANSKEQGGNRFATSTLGIQISNYRQVTSSTTSVADTLSRDRPPARKSRAIATDNSNRDRGSTIEFERKGFKLVQTITLALSAERGYNSFVISPDGNIIAIGGGKSLQIRRVSDGVVTYNLEVEPELNNNFIRSLAISTNGQVLAIGTDRGIEIRKTSSGEIIKQIDDKKAGWQIALSGDGSTVAGSRLGDSIKVYRVSDGQLIHTLVAKNAYLSRVEIDDISISPDGLYIASRGVNDGTRVWQMSNGKLIKHLNSKFWFIGFSLDSKSLLTSQVNPTKLNPTAQRGFTEEPDDSSTIKSWMISNNQSSIVMRKYQGGEINSISGLNYRYQFSKDKKIFVTSKDKRNLMTIDNGGRIMQIWQR
jgi:WD40 repeat protein